MMISSLDIIVFFATTSGNPGFAFFNNLFSLLVSSSVSLGAWVSEKLII